MARRTSRSDDKVVAGCAPATAALPETQSYYRSSIDAARRDSQNSSHRQYHAANSLYRTPSVTSFSAAAPSSSPGAGLAPKPQTRTAAPDAPLPSNIDDDIARGLAEEDTGRRSYSGRGSSWRGDGDENNTASGSFVPQRNARKTQSILPPAGFFAPKKPPQLASRTSPLPGQASAQLPHSSSTSTSRSGAYLQAMDTASVGDAVSHPLNGSSQSDAWLDSRDAASAKARTSPSIKSTSSAQGMAAERYPMTPSHVATSLSLRKGETDEFEAGPAPSVREQASRDALLQASERSHDPRTVQDEQRSSRRLSPMGTGFSHPTAASHARPSNEKRAPASSSQAAPARADGGIARQRRYKTHRGGNRFFLCGLIMTSDDNLLAFLGSLILMIGLPVLWLVFDAPYTWRHVSPAPVIVLAYLYAVSFSSMCVTSLRDPGVLPRDLDPDPPCTAGEGTGFVPPSDPLAIPVPRIVRVRHGTDLKVKWCDTCGTYRPPRTSHCRVCDNCVENIDHHCTFLNTCIGRRNYFTFFAFLIASILASFVSVAFSAIHVYYLTKPATPQNSEAGKTFRDALAATPVSAVMFFLGLGVAAPLVTLLCYHIRLIAMNRTTVEQIRISATRNYSEKPSYEDGFGEDDDSLAGGGGGGSKACLSARKLCCCCGLNKLGQSGHDPNPFAYRTISRNMRAALLRPMTAESWIKRYDYAVPDTRRPNPASPNLH